jgi:hypothetical protein
MNPLLTGLFSNLVLEADDMGRRALLEKCSVILVLTNVEGLNRAEFRRVCEALTALLQCSEGRAEWEVVRAKFESVEREEAYLLLNRL